MAMYTRSASFLLLLFLFLLSALAKAQVTGVVTDQQSGKPLSKADVFINSTTLAAITNEKGEFQLQGIAPGFAELVIYKSGYELFKSSLRIQADKAYKLNLQIIPTAEKPKTAKVKADEEYRKNMQWFERGLLGTTSNTAVCKITNAKALQLTRSGDIIHVSATEPLVIENNALGYRVKIYLQDFDAGVEDVHIRGAQKYDTMSSRDFTQRDTWQRNRLKAYWGSERHLFYALLQGRAGQEGFELTDAQGKRLQTDTLVGKGKLPGYSRIKLSNKTQVRYQIERGSSGIQQTDQQGQISWIVPKEGIEVSQDGLLFNRKSIEVSGYWAQNRLADQLPDNYFPTSTLEAEQMDWQNFGLLREKIYLHTDRDYYYPRENIWFKAYMGYSSPVLRDTLSKTLYVDLISPGKEVIQSKVYRINGGSCWGDFKLPDSLAAGQYAVRAYTNWLRNYGDSAYFMKPIPILDFSQNLEAAPGVQDSKALSPFTVKIQTNKNQFSERERVELSVEVRDQNGNPVRANLSMAVVDAHASVPIPQTGNIQHPAALAVPRALKSDKYFDQIEHFMERGLSFRGVVKDDKGTPTPADIEIIQGNMMNLISMETDDKGEFLVTGLNFTDSMTFAFKPKNKKGRPLTKVEILDYVEPEVAALGNPLPLTFRKENALQRIQNSFVVDDNTILLNEVEVKGKRITDEAQKGSVKVYGQPDYTVKGDMIRSTVAGTNLLVGLQGKVPGLQVIESMDGGGLPIISVRVRGGTSSLAGGTEPLIMVDGVPFPDAKSISGIDPSQVDRVEVVTRAVPQYGSRGTNGVIAIYTKTGAYATDSKPNYLTHKIKGYNTARAFFSPDYSTEKDDAPDFRTTVYWRPSLLAEPTAEVSFYTADLPGEYRIVVEGVTEKGEPVRGVATIKVE